MEHFYQKIQGWFNFPKLYKSAVEKFDNAVFVEVGTWQGKSAAYMAVEIVNSKKNIKFYCVDTWKGSQEHRSDNLVKTDTLYECFLQNINIVNHAIYPLRMTSLEAAENFKNNSIDFVFIDAEHDYENVKKDMSAWFPKVKKGGIFAGHDYCGSWPGVIKAVDEFTESKKLNLKTQESCWLVYI